LPKGGLTLSQAEALTLGSDETQRSIIEEIARGDEFSAEGIRATLLGRPPDRGLGDLSGGALYRDHHDRPVCEDETSYFDDAEQFMALQKDAVGAACEAPRGIRRMGGRDAGLAHSRVAVSQGAEEPEGRRF